MRPGDGASTRSVASIVPMHVASVVDRVDTHAPAIHRTFVFRIRPNRSRVRPGGSRPG
jgi:hypothetical protein